MSATATSFYVTGGTLRSDAPSYIERQADRDLYEGLSRGEFCYVLTARQMGKSSLMIRTASRLRQEGVAVVVLDLTAIGQNLTPEQWYDGLRDLLGQQLDLEEELDDFWLAEARFGPLQRWMKALREVVLARVPGRIVIFLDEIDADRNLQIASNKAEELKRLAAALQVSLDERDKLFRRLVAVDHSFSWRRGNTPRVKMAQTAEKGRRVPMPRKVLVVDDDQAILRLLEANLVGAGYQVLTASDGPEALQKAGVEDPDLVVLDDLMPTMDGFEVLRRLKGSQATEEIPVIMVAERAKNSDVSRGYQLGADAFLTKPINPAEFLAFVKQVLDSQAGLPEAGREIPITGDDNPLVRISHTILQQAINEGPLRSMWNPRPSA
jgi:CheY-like chemotaxis protein